jgi:copper chaperone CopZ
MRAGVPRIMLDGELASVHLSVPDINCAHCERTVKGALEPVPGVREVTVDIPGKKVHVLYDPDRVVVGHLGDVLAEEGYPVASVD